MLLRAFLIWLILIPIAILNGMVREVLFAPRWGEKIGHWLSTLTLCVAILVVAKLAIDWIHPPNAAAAWMVGAVWLVLTLAFEFLAGHFIFNQPWKKLLADYDLRRGRIWLAVLITTLIAPVLTAQ